jgi:two-component system, OmpR family, osmolarity sensor histidine kinase EnvZ
MFSSIKHLLPRGLYGRAALILILPVVIIQIVVSITFIQRHFERVTEQMTEGVALEIQVLRNQISGADTLDEARARLAPLAKSLALEFVLPAGVPKPGDIRALFDWSGRAVITTIRSKFPDLIASELPSPPRLALFTFDSKFGPFMVTVDRTRVSASNPHQLLVLMLVTSALMTFIAYLFLRNQLRPIKQLGDAAAAFGKGQHAAYRPRGALEVRAAGMAFLDMRGRIERQIEQRTLMLSGISHDLRSPLTRLKLGLSLLAEDEDTKALMRDVSDMERLVDEFLAFVRGDAMESPEDCDPVALAERAVENAQRMGQTVAMADPVGQGEVRLRRAAVMRALENLIGNAVRYGTLARVSVVLTEKVLRFQIEDDGPGIPKERREEALMPFTRLDGARNPNKGGGVGLGLSIAADIARSHGGTLRLGESEALGGLKAELVFAR